jgi:5-methyltetrahydrofolate--homocysteine methyltransferase
MAKIREQYDMLRDRHASRHEEKELLSLEEARKNALRLSFDGANRPVAPKSPGVFDIRPSLEELRPFIDWTPFFLTWEMRGKYPAIFDDPNLGEEAKKLFADANTLLDEIIAGKLIEARGVYGLFPASAEGDSILIYKDESRKEVAGRFEGLRQQGKKREGEPNRSLSDLVAPASSGVPDWMGAFVVTAGIGLEKLVSKFEADHDDYRSIMAKALADRLAEAFAEWLHDKVRREFWGYETGDRLSNEDLIREKYNGIRPAPGYPSQPDHTEKRELFRLLDATQRAHVQLTESLAMYPAASVSGLYFAHPEAAYFHLGRIGEDQLEDYAKRKGMTIEEAARWLSPIL